MNEELFDRFEALTFDDVVIVPGWTEVLPDATDTACTFAAGIRLAIPAPAGSRLSIEQQTPPTRTLSCGERVHRLGRCRRPCLGLCGTADRTRRDSEPCH